MFILDTDHLGILQGRKLPEADRLLARIAARTPTEFFTTIVSFHEQVAGWSAYLAKARDRAGVVRAYRGFQQILADFARAQVLPFDEAAGARFDALRAGRVRVATMDLRIASIALANGFTLLTRNLVDFRLVPGLAVEDWTT